MRSAMDFFPSCITPLMNLVSIRSWNFGSGRIFLFSTTRRRGISNLYPASTGLLGSVLGTPLLAVGDADRVQGTTDDVVTNAGQVLHTAAADEHHGVLLQVVAHARDGARHLDAVAEPNTGDLAERGVRLRRRGGVHAGADAPLLGRTLESGRLLLRLDLPAALANQLSNRRHSLRSHRPAHGGDVPTKKSAAL